VNDRHTHWLESVGYRYGDHGAVALSGTAAVLFHCWVRFILRFLNPFSNEYVHGAPTIASDVLETAGYLEHFPQQLVRPHEAIGAGDSTYGTPAACFHVYPRLSGRVFDKRTFSSLVSARCSRHEAGKWEAPFRLCGFHMIELVFVGPRTAIETKREEIQQRTARLFAELGIRGDFAPASDAFFMANSRGAQIIQRLKELKREYNVAVDGEKVAVASTNYHEDYFGKRFAIEEADGRPASSCCTAFGVERLTALGLLTWGQAPRGWPEAFRP
jgi:seryl-tRNA synthetase